MEIKRDRYLNQLISYMWDGQVKVITGIRRCGKSYLLRTLFRQYLLEHGITAEQIPITRMEKASLFTMLLMICGLFQIWISM